MRQATSIALEATITRADGTVEPLGTVAYWHKSRIRRMIYRLRGGKGKVNTNAGSRPSSS